MRTFNVILGTGIFALSALSSVSAWAEPPTRWGGDVVICPSGKTELLDYSRAKHEWHLEVVFSTAKDEFEKAKEIVQRVSWLDRLRSEEYQATIDSIRNSAHFDDESVGFQVSDDTRKYGTCEGGRVVQVIQQINPYYPEDVRYRINKKVWDTLDLDTRAGLLVHESILNEKMITGSEAGVLDSVAYFNSYISSQQFLNSSDVNSYYQRLMKVGLFGRGYLVRLMGITKLWGTLHEEDRPDDTIVLSVQLTRSISVECESSQMDVPVTGRIDVKSDQCERLRVAIQNLRMDEELRLTFVHHNNMIWSPRSRVERFEVVRSVQ